MLINSDGLNNLILLIIRLIYIIKVLIFLRLRLHANDYNINISKIKITC